MIKTNYICDRCAHPQESPDQFWVIGVKAKPYGYTTSQWEASDHQMQVCRPCLEVLGFHVRAPKKDEPPLPAPPTLEELIREIVQSQREQQS